jgi:hypothetical protein
VDKVEGRLVMTHPWLLRAFVPFGALRLRQKCSDRPTGLSM